MQFAFSKTWLKISMEDETLVWAGYIKVALYSFSGSIPPKCEHKLRRHKQRFGKIGQLHDDDIWLQLPEFISVLLCYCQSRWGLKNNSLNLHKKTTNSRILVVVVKWRHRAIVLLTPQFLSESLSLFKGIVSKFHIFVHNNS